MNVRCPRCQAPGVADPGPYTCSSCGYVYEFAQRTSEAPKRPDLEAMVAHDYKRQGAEASMFGSASGSIVANDLGPAMKSAAEYALHLEAELEALREKQALLEDEARDRS